MTTREIITLQFGHYSNYVGTHFWNLQEFGFNYDSCNTETNEINHDVLFREGHTPKGETTYTPRLLLVDLKNSLKSLPQTGNLYDCSQETAEIEYLWDNDKIEVKKDNVVSKTKYQEVLATSSNDCTPSVQSHDIEKDIRVWSDFMYSRFHPRSINVIKEYEQDNDTLPFDVFHLGSSVWDNEAFQDNFSDNIRKYVEECDAFQGFHILLDANNAFAGLSTSSMQYLREEYGSKSILAVPLLPSHYRDYNHSTEAELQQSQLKDSIRILNTVLCFDSLREHSDLFVPMSVAANGWRRLGGERQFGHLVYNHESSYHTTAILAAALDTFTLKQRAKSTLFTLGDLTSGLTPHKRKMVAASICFPFAFNVGADLIQCLDSWNGHLTRSLTPEFETINENVIQMITLRGIGEQQLKKPVDRAGSQKDLPAYKCNSINELLTMYLDYSTDRSVNNISNIKKALDVKAPFPQIFDNRINRHGYVDSTERPSNEHVMSVPVMAGLHSHGNLGKSLESLHTEVRRIKVARLHQFLTSGLEMDEYAECLDRLFDFRECYEDNYFI